MLALLRSDGGTVEYVSLSRRITATLARCFTTKLETENCIPAGCYYYHEPSAPPSPSARYPAFAGRRVSLAVGPRGPASAILMVVLRSNDCGLG